MGFHIKDYPVRSRSESKSLILTLAIFNKWGFTVIIRDLEGTGIVRGPFAYF